MHTITPSRAAIGARIRSEGPIPLDLAGTLFRVPASTGTLLRWIISGKARVRLEATRVGGKWHTSAGAVARFRQAAGL
jgi:hypothetical protein